MSHTHGTKAKACVSVLEAMKEEYFAKAIYPSYLPIIDQMVDRQLELNSLFGELFDQLAERTNALWVFFDVVLACAVFFNEERSAAARKDRDELRSLNGEISVAAARLANLLKRREELEECSGFDADACYHVIDIVNRAAQFNQHYSLYLKEELLALKGQYDLKYWPPLSEFVEEIAVDAGDSVVEAAYPEIHTLTQGQRPSRSDFFRVLFQKIEDAQGRDAPHLPEDFHLTDGVLAALGSCLLGLQDDELLDASYVKGVRQRQRREAKRP